MALPCLRNVLAVGMVSRVRCRETGMDFAMKTIQLERMSPTMIKEMRNEIDILRRLDHPNIIRKTPFYLSHERPHWALPV